MSTSDPVTTQPSTAQSVWRIDPSHSLVEFSIRHMMVTTVKGHFSGIQGTILDVAEDPTRSSVDIQVDPNTVATGDEKRDAHLRSADFFDTETFPAVTFKSKRIEGSREAFTMTGDLTIRGVTREVVLDVTYNGQAANPWGKTVAGFTADTKLNRKDFGLNWNVALESGGWLVSDTLKLSIEIEAVREE